MRTLLRNNSEYLHGAWELARSEDMELAVFSICIAADAGPQEIQTTVLFVASIAFQLRTHLLTQFQQN